jgi:hypothetical protein
MGQNPFESVLSPEAIRCLVGGVVCLGVTETLGPVYTAPALSNTLAQQPMVSAAVRLSVVVTALGIILSGAALLWAYRTERPDQNIVRASVTYICLLFMMGSLSTLMSYRDSRRKPTTSVVRMNPTTDATTHER